MKTIFMTKSLLRIQILPLVILLADPIKAETPPLQRKFEINVRGIPLTKVFEMIATKADLSLNYQSSNDTAVHYSSGEVQLKDLLDLLSRKNGLQYRVHRRQLIVSPIPRRGIASEETLKGISIIPLNYSQASDIAPKITQFFGDKVQVSTNNSSNSIILSKAGSKLSNIKAFIRNLDRIPKQVFIEAKIVESSSNFVRDLGLSWGNLNATGGDRGNLFAIKNPGPANPNLLAGYRLGTIGESALDVQLTAAESRGDARVISRPKIVTEDRQTAVIQSGITYHVKTLTRNADSAESNTDNSSEVSGGLTSVTAGLTLEVKPIVVDQDIIQLVLSLTNSETDRGSSVDGIPGIISSSAKTSIMVKEGSTATIAGLVKFRDSNTESGVPVLSWIPVFGSLFKSLSTDHGKRELMIFMTPRVVSPLATLSDDSNKEVELKTADSLIRSIGSLVEENKKAKKSEPPKNIKKVKQKKTQLIKEEKIKAELKNPMSDKNLLPPPLLLPSTEL